MQFAHDTEESLEFAVELANTAPEASRSGDDELATPEQLAEMLAQYPFSGRIDGDEAERRDVLRAREVSWADVGQVLGVSRQSAWERFS